MRRSTGLRRAAEKGLKLCRRHETSGRPADLAAGIRLLRSALACPGTPAELASVQGNLGAALWKRFEGTQDRAALDESIALRSAAISSGALGVATRSRWTHDLARGGGGGGGRGE
jgi:hypothetical protein